MEDQDLLFKASAYTQNESTGGLAVRIGSKNLVHGIACQPEPVVFCGFAGCGNVYPRRNQLLASREVEQISHCLCSLSTSKGANIPICGFDAFLSSSQRELFSSVA